MADQQAARIAIVGSGFVGRSWAALFAAHGHGVAVHDPDPAALERVQGEIETLLDQLASFGLIGENAATVLSRISVEPDLAAAVADADYIQENAPENLGVKRALFGQLDRLSPARAILASSSSSLTCSQVCTELPGRARCLVAHPANPPHLLRAVELVPAPFTDRAVIERAAAILKGVGQVAVVIGEIEGFVMNRLQAALTREALQLVEKGIADAATVDAIVKHSLGVRWAFMGPFETMDLNAPAGFADYARRYGSSFAGFFGEAGWNRGVVEAVDHERRRTLATEDLPTARAWRDRRLAALIAHLRDEAKR